jgi:hypothetical protein
MNLDGGLIGAHRRQVRPKRPDYTAKELHPE